MPTPLPPDDQVDLDPPDAGEAAFLARGVCSAIRPPGGLTELQRVLVEALFEAMTNSVVDAQSSEPIDPETFAAGLAHRNATFRGRVVQNMVLGALVLHPLPPEVDAQVRAFATALDVDDGMLAVASRLARGQLGLASIDFERNGYTSDWSPERARALHTSSHLAEAWELSVADPALVELWASLEHLPADSLGRSVWEFYEARGFAFPGSVGSAPPLLAQHDWVHVLADYGTRVESELEVFAFIARANDDPKGFSLLAMVISLFETGYFDTGAGLFESFPGQLSRVGMATRVADAMRRGAKSHGLDGAPDVDLLAVDWFSLADRSIADLRREFGITRESDAALAAGSVGPWEPGGISPHQFQTARQAAIDAGRPYHPHGALP